jgi:hypothetical protein
VKIRAAAFSAEGGVSIPVRIEDIIYYRPTRKAKVAKSINHVFAGVLLLLYGLLSLLRHESDHLFLDGLSVAAGAALLFSFFCEIRRSQKAEHHRIGWVDVCAGIVILLEAWHKFNPAKRFQPAVLLALVGIVTLLLGFFHHKLSRIARLKCDERGFFSKSSLWRGLHVRWTDVVAVEYEPAAILVTTRSGRNRRIGLRRYANKEEISEFFNRHWERRRPA